MATNTRMVERGRPVLTPQTSGSLVPRAHFSSTGRFEQPPLTLPWTFEERQIIVIEKFRSLTMNEFRQWLDRFLSTAINQDLPQNYRDVSKFRDDYEYDVWVSMIYNRVARYRQAPSWVQERLRNTLVSQEALDDFVREEMPDIAMDIIRFRDLRLAREARAAGHRHRRQPR
ncbi:Hypothetical protein D9617_21g097310 [Elsinoe fawcettii]|nr:Hypothetical protein D9617_21g097310 [Elsinoe fawcettii]